MVAGLDVQPLALEDKPQAVVVGRRSRLEADGSLGMAKTSAPNSGGSQWFIDYAPQPSLDGGYTVFGQLVSGRDVLDKIKLRNPDTATTPGTVINTIEIEEQ